MAALEALAIGLSIVFGGFVLVLLAELFYVIIWKRYGILSKRVRRINTECSRGICNFANEAALVGSFGGYSASSVDTEFVANVFPMGSEATCRDTMFMDGLFGESRLLFTIKEETEEDMEFEDHVKEHKESATSFFPVQALHSESLKQPSESQSPKEQQLLQRQFPHSIGILHSESPKPPSESPCPKEQQLLQRQFPHSIGVFQQPQILRSISTKSISWTPTALQQQNALQGPSDLSLHSSCSHPSSPPCSLSSSSPSSPTSTSISPTLISPKYQAFCSSGSSSPELFCVSNPVYELDSNEISCNTQPNAISEENENEIEIEAPCNIQSSGCSSPHETETPFDTPMASPSLLSPSVSPPMTPRLTPIKASKDPCAISIGMANYRSGTSYISSSVESDLSSSSSKSSSPSSESCHESPIFHYPKRPSRSRTMMVPSYPNTASRKPTVMERRAFASLLNRPFLQSLPHV